MHDFDGKIEFVFAVSWERHDGWKRELEAEQLSLKKELPVGSMVFLACAPGLGEWTDYRALVMLRGRDESSV